MEYKEIILYPKQNIKINSTENNIANQNNLIDFIKSIPNPIVKVTDIEKVSSSNSVAVSVSSL